MALLTSGFAIRQLTVVKDSIQSGVMPGSTSFDYGYSRYPATAYLHMLPGLLFIGRAYVCIRNLDITRHREWVIRAFAIGLGVSTIGLLVPVFQLTTDMTFQEFFGIAFWIAFVAHAVVAEFWIRSTR